MSDPRSPGREDLPAAVRDLAIRLGVRPGEPVADVRLTQTGRMKTSLTSKGWIGFKATQTISARTCEFDWRARAGPLGLISGRDALLGGEGRFDIMALGLVPIARARHTAALVRGELMRYLAEITWAPQAILHNHTLRWEVTDADTLAVSAGTGETACRVVLSLDGDGWITGSFAPDRPRNAVAPTQETPWRGRFSDYRLHDGRWLPFHGEVAWEIDGQTLTYWQGRLERWETAA